MKLPTTFRPSSTLAFASQVACLFVMLLLGGCGGAGSEKATGAAAGDVLKKSGVIEPGTDVAQTVKDLIDNSFAGKLPTAKAATALK